MNDILLNKVKSYPIGSSETITGIRLIAPIKVLFRIGDTKVYTDATLTGSTVTYIIPLLPRGDY